MAFGDGRQNDAAVDEIAAERLADLERVAVEEALQIATVLDGTGRRPYSVTSIVPPAALESLTTESVVTSRDGTVIGCSEMGEGPSIVLVHGAMQTSRSFEKLAQSLARSFRVVRYDRRGRGRSAAGSNQVSDRFAREKEDLGAVVAATSARYIFGLSSGALVTMGAALEASSVEKVVLYEPPLAMDGVDPGDWADDFLRALAKQRLGRAMALLLKGTADRDPLRFVPSSVLALVFGFAVRKGAKTPSGESLRSLLLTVPGDIAIQREASKTIPPLSRFLTPTLLLGGDRSHPKLTRVLDGIERDLPAARRALIRGSGHIAADNDGKPDDVARAIDAFLRPSGFAST